MTKRTLILTTLLVGAAYSWAGSLPALAGTASAPISSNIPVVDNIKLQIEAKSNVLKGKSNYDNLTHSLNINSGIYNVDTVQKVNVLTDIIKASNFKEKSEILSSSSKGLMYSNKLKPTTKKEDPTPIYTDLNYVSLTESDGGIMYFYFDKDKNITDIVSVWDDSVNHFTYEDLSVEDKEYINNKVKDLINDKKSVVNFESITLEDSLGDFYTIYYDKDGNLQAIKQSDGSFWAKEVLVKEEVEVFQEALNEYLNPKEEVNRE